MTDKARLREERILFMMAVSFFFLIEVGIPGLAMQKGFVASLRKEIHSLL